MTRRLFALALALLLFLPLLALANEAEQPETAEESNFFAAMKLTNLDGSPFDTSVFIGKPTLLNIWATWCPPCIGELPHLNELAKEYGERINIIGLHSEGLTITPAGELAGDDGKNAAAIKLRDEQGLTFPLVNPDQLLFVLLNDPQYGLSISVLPTTWLIDGEGYIRSVVESAYDKAGWAEIIDQFLSDLEQEENAKDAG